jgi:O-antigen/teichoic acid export membrane protein
MGVIRRQGIKNNIILYIGAFLGFFNVLIVQPTMLNPSEVGLVRLLYSVAILFASLYPLGGNSFILKYFPYIRNDKSGHHGFAGFLILFSTALFVVGSSIFYGLKPYLLTRYIGNEMFIEQFNFIFPMAYLLGLFTILSSYSTAIFKTTVPSFLNEIVFRGIIIISISLYYIHIIDFQTMVWLYSFSGLVLVIFLIIYLKRNNQFNLIPSKAIFNNIPAEAIRFTILTGFAGLASVMFKNIDAVFIGSYMELSDVAVYTVARTISTMIDIPASALSKIVTPKFSEGFRNKDMEFLKRLYYKTNRVLLFCGSLLFTGIFINAGEILTFLPEGYSTGESILRILAIGTLVNNVAGLNFVFLQYSNKYFMGSLIFIALGILSTLFNVLLIPSMGLIGAALGSAFSVCFVNIIVFFYNKFYFGFQPIEKIDVIILLMTFSFVGLNFLLPDIHNTWLSLLVKSVVLFVAYGILFLKTNLLNEIITVSHLFKWKARIEKGIKR